MSRPVVDQRAACARAVRILLVANDGFSAGHVARVLAVARRLPSVAARRGLSVQLVFATTSEADALWRDVPVAVVRLPHPLAARRAGLSDAERRRIVRAAIDAVAESFAPDVVVIDTFPTGPHGELQGLLRTRAKRVLLRRDVPSASAQDDLMVAGIERFDRLIAAADPGPPPAHANPSEEARRTVGVSMVPPITLYESDELMTRADARTALGIGVEEQAILVAAGGGGDEVAVLRAGRLVDTVRRVAPAARVCIAAGPLAPRAGLTGDRDTLHVAPLQPYLAAFDGAISSAGYNTAHELAKAGVPTALFAEPRPYDDQEARARRFQEARLAWHLKGFDDDSVRHALRSMKSPAVLPSGGAERAAEIVLDVVERAAE